MLWALVRAVALKIAALPTTFGRGGQQLQDLKPAKTTADGHVKALDPEPVEQREMGASHVADGNHGKAKAKGFSVCRIGRSRSGGAPGTADHIRRDDIVFVGIDRFSRTDRNIPPAGPSGRVLIGRQSVQHQDCIVAGRRQTAIGLTGDFEFCKPFSGLQRQTVVYPNRVRFGA